MKKSRTEEMKMNTARRLTAVLLAVVFVFGTLLLPTQLYAEETAPEADSTAEAAAEIEPAAEQAPTEAAEADQTAEQTEAADADNAETDAEQAAAEAEPADMQDTVAELSELVEMDPANENEYNGFIYKLKDDTTKTEIREMEQSIDQLDGNQEAEEIVNNELYTADSIETISEVAQPGQIEYIEPNYIVEACAAPNDPKYNAYKWQLEMTNVPYIWDKGMTGTGTVIAVIDSGVNTGHPDLAGVKFVNKYNAQNGTTDVTDDFGHGTMITGLIAETRNNGIGFTGILSKTRIMPIKVLDNKGRAELSIVIRAIDRAIDKKADVINTSFGITFKGKPSKSFEDAYKRAVNAGIIVVASSGNDAQDGNPIVYPAAYDCVVSVGSVDKRERISDYSTYNDEVTVVAPGEKVILLNGSGGYSVGYGTSFSAPQVSALAAMVKSCNSSINQKQFMNILQSTSKDLGDEGYDVHYGYGLVDFAKVFDYLATDFANYKMVLSDSLYDYNGSVQTPAVTVKLGNVKLAKDTDYTVSYPGGMKKVGNYKITVKGTGNFSGTKRATFKIRPPLVKPMKKPLRYKTRLTARWKTMSESQITKYGGGITGYQVRVSKKSDFTGAKYKKVKGLKKTKATVTGLKRHTTYYVQYRSYKVKNGVTYYSRWSTTKKTKTK